MVPPLTTSLPTIHHLHMSREAANIPDTQKRTPTPPRWSVGTWQEAVFLAEHYREAASICVSPSPGSERLVQVPRVGWGRTMLGRTREGFERYIRKTEDPARLPTFRMSLSKDRRCSVFQRQFRKHTFLWEFSLFHSTPSTSEPWENQAIKW